MEKRYEITPILLLGTRMFRAQLYYIGDAALVDSWDIVEPGFNVSQATQQERLARGYTDADLTNMNAVVKSYVDAREGRR